MEQKIIKIGNSLGVILPKSVRGNLKAGQTVNIASEGNKIVISEPDAQTSVDPAFLQTAEKLLAKYSKALEELSQK